MENSSVDVRSLKQSNSLIHDEPKHCKLMFFLYVQERFNFIPTPFIVDFGVSFQGPKADSTTLDGTLTPANTHPWFDIKKRQSQTNDPASVFF